MSNSLRIVAVGDLSFNGAYSRVLEREGVGHPFLHVAGEWAGADLRLGNLESPLTDARRAAASKLALRGAAGAAMSLASAGFDAVSLANNHAMDYGPEGLVQTLERLREAGISAVGAGRDAREATAPVVLHRRGQSVGMLACCDVEQRSPLYARENGAAGDPAGVAGMAPDEVEQAIWKLRGEVDRVVVQLHWGHELSQLPSPGQRRDLARRFVHAGADLILGHHPHTLQPMEVIAGVPVFYSLGNFLFSEMFWRGRPDRGGPAFLAKYRLHPLSARTGWAEVTFTPGQPTRARLVTARLGADHAVRQEATEARVREWEELQARLRAADYAEDAALELVRARERLRWQEDWRPWRRRLETRLFGYGLLPTAVEGT